MVRDVKATSFLIIKSQTEMDCNPLNLQKNQVYLSPDYQEHKKEVPFLLSSRHFAIYFYEIKFML